MSGIACNENLPSYHYHEPWSNEKASGFVIDRMLAQDAPSYLLCLRSSPTNKLFLVLGMCAETSAKQESWSVIR